MEVSGVLKVSKSWEKGIRKIRGKGNGGVKEGSSVGKDDLKRTKEIWRLLK